MPTAEELSRAARLIREGGLVAFPTETVYGLGANALDAGAVRRIFAMKGRPETSPLIVHVASVAEARELVSEWPDLAEELAATHWPGPLTLVLPKLPLVPDEVTAGLTTVGIRMPAHPVALSLIREAGVPLAAPSANRFTELSPTTAEHVRAAFGDSVMVLDGGATNVGIESTVVSLAGPEPVLLRPGMIPFGEIRRMSDAGAGAHPSPGMHERHYSPRATLMLIDRSAPLPHGRIAYVWWNVFRNAAKNVRMPASPDEYAARLYATLHELDAEGWDGIAVERPPEGSAWAGILDRLERASKGSSQ
jgi:L-threonylcarbamoyladenylate synthase